MENNKNDFLTLRQIYKLYEVNDSSELEIVVDVANSRTSTISLYKSEIEHVLSDKVLDGRITLISVSGNGNLEITIRV